MGGARGGRPPPLSLDQTKARKAEKKFFGDPSPPPPHLSLSEGLDPPLQTRKLGNKISRPL